METTITTVSYGSYAHIIVEEPHGLFDDEITTYVRTLTYDHERKLYALMLGTVHNVEIGERLKERKYTSELGNGTTAYSRALLDAAKDLIK